MKVCRKCKSKLANKTKICSRCGSDVSKCKIIKNNSHVSINNKVKEVTNNEIKEVKNVDVKSNLDLGLDIHETIKYDIKEEISSEENCEKLEKVKNNKFLVLGKKLLKFIKRKKFRKSMIIVVVLGIVTYISFFTYNYFFEVNNEIVVGEKATNNKLFSQKDIITYKGVNYQVLDVELSEGNSYKSPKEGNVFLIVTVQIENNTNNKINYSYKNWTMSNSLGEEEKRIFTSINVDTALYSGELVIGGIKRGSMVFEQPKDDKKLKLNFYELSDTKDGKKDIDKEKKIFSVSVKIPEEVKKVSKTDS